MRGNIYKKILLVISLISVLLLAGCNKDSKLDNTSILENTDNQQEEIDSNGINNFNAKDYEGNWENLEIIAKSTNIIEFKYTVISKAPYYRIAGIDIKDVKLDENGFGEFEFEDSFLNTGKGSIHLVNNKVILNISELNISDENSSGWSIGFGEKVFEHKSYANE